jgi:hypothetical protein
VKLRLKTSVRNFGVSILNFSGLQAKAVASTYSKRFPFIKEIILTGKRSGLFFALQGLAELALTRLTLKFVQSNTTSKDSEPFLDGVAISAACGGFPKLERIDFRNLGPFSPKAFIKTCTSANGLKMIRMTKCPTLMDPCLELIVNIAPNLQELTLEECSSLISPVLCSTSLVRLKLSKCFSLRAVNVDQCTSLVILDVPWTVQLTQVPQLDALSSLRYLSLASSAQLEEFIVDRLPKDTSTLDLGCCTRLRRVAVGYCPNLIFVNLTFCIELETITLRHAYVLEELDLSLLENLTEVDILHDFSLKKVIIYGCAKLDRNNIRTTSPTVLRPR